MTSPPGVTSSLPPLVRYQELKKHTLISTHDMLTEAESTNSDNTSQMLDWVGRAWPQYLGRMRGYFFFVYESTFLYSSLEKVTILNRDLDYLDKWEIFVELQVSQNLEKASL